ncbi:hypothetical protein [Streptomyces sp. LS1784]|uniref:hypothetical protein n=1 Tax=Streptomyces sp. LS1784 TaxID=2851533 RepID=UPI001CD01996|nr:hypothetical protein [Streptomyces sp. LS1784]
MSRFLGGRRAARAAGAVSAVLLALTGVVVGTAVPATAAPAVAVRAALPDDGGLNPGDILTGHNFIMQLDGQSVEYIAEVSGLDPDNHTVTLSRGLFRSPIVQRWIDDAIAGREGRLKNMTIGICDYAGNIVKRYNFGGAFVEKIVLDNATHEPSILTVRYFTFNIG